jgi:hypothetical protein
MKEDELWKGLMESLPVQFLQCFFADAVDTFDLTKPIHFLDKELAQLAPESEDGKRIVDNLMQITTKIGYEHLIYIHNEVQGYGDNVFDERNFIYFYRLYDRLKKPIAALLIYTDTDPNYRPSSFKYSFLGT